MFFASKQKSAEKVESLPKLTIHNITTHLGEATIWIIILIILVAVRFTSKSIFDSESTVWLSGLVVAFALAYYSFIYRYFNTKQRHYIKDIADVLFIGILGTLAKDYSVYFFTLYILPIAAAALALDILNSLVVATFASLFIAGNIVLNTRFFAAAEPLYFGSFQIVFLILMTFFTRTLAIQLRREKSERTFFEEKLRQADAKLQNVEAVEEEFVSITTHQLNTPLSIIRGYSSMLLAGDAGKLTAKQQRYAKEIHQGCLRLTKLIRDLLDVTHVEAATAITNPKAVNLVHCVTKVVKDLTTKAKANKIKLDTRVPKQAIIVTGNEVQLEQVISNLIDNAIKYSDEGRDIVIKLEKSEKGREVLLTVEDHGIGIPEDEQERIFQRFYRASNSQTKDANGTGLGLYIVKQIVETHEGSISFTSDLNQGTVFQVRLPARKVD